MDRIKANYAALTTPDYRATSQGRGRKNGHNEWQKDHAKAVDATRGAKKRGNHHPILSKWQDDETQRWRSGVLKLTSSTSTTSSRLTSSTKRLTAKDIVMKT